jgi:arsenate reductase (glutaredoxin)
LQALFDEIGLSPGDVLSKRSRAYKELGLAERTVTDRELIELMAQYPTLLRRPLVIGDDGEVVVGFNKDELGRLVHGDA